MCVDVVFNARVARARVYGTEFSDQRRRRRRLRQRLHASARWDGWKNTKHPVTPQDETVWQTQRSPNERKRARARAARVQKRCAAAHSKHTMPRLLGYVVC